MGSGVDAAKLVGTEGKQVLQKTQIPEPFLETKFGTAGAINPDYYVIAADRE